MAADSVFGRPVEGGRLNPIYTLGAAVAGTLLVLAALLFAFSRPVAPPVVAPRMLLRIVQNPVAVPVAVAAKPRARRNVNSSRSHEAPRIQSLPPFSAELLRNLPALLPPALNLSPDLLAPTLPLSATSGPPVFNLYSPIYQALNSHRKQPILKNGQTLRLVGFPTITKYGGYCYVEKSLPTFGLSPMPPRKVPVRVGCPGSYQPSMGDELDTWANKEKKKLDGNSSG